MVHCHYGEAYAVAWLLAKAYILCKNLTKYRVQITHGDN